MEASPNSLHGAAKKSKEDGSRHFKERNYQLALSCYMDAIELYDTLIDEYKETIMYNHYNKERQVIRANVSQVYLSQEKYKDCMSLCKQLLDEDEMNPGTLDDKIREKTRFRLCKAMGLINQNHDFISDLGDLNLRTDPSEWTLFPSCWSSDKTKCDQLIFDRGVSISSNANENLVVILHGFGDNPSSFSQLPKHWKLEKTSYLFLPGCDNIASDFCSSTNAKSKPVFSWFDYFDPLTYEWYDDDSMESFNSCTNNIKQHLDQLIRVHLVKECGWKLEQIFLLGFSQGGTMALDYLFWLNEQQVDATLGGVIAISSQIIGARRKSVFANQKNKTTDKKNQYCIQTPVLLIHGEKDDKIVPKNHLDSVQCLKMSMEPKFAESNFVHKLFPKRGHEMLRGSNRDEMKLFYNFMANHLNGVGKKKERESIKELVQNQGFIPL